MPHADVCEIILNTSMSLHQKVARCNLAFIRFCYDVYFSPQPATFVRKTHPVDSPAPLLLAPPGGPSTNADDESGVDIVIRGELEPGSTGVVHTGTMVVDSPDEKIAVAVKLGFSDDDKLALEHEYTVYCDLHSKDVSGIPQVYGLFRDEELIDGGEGPHALIMSFAGSALCSIATDIPTHVKSVHLFELPRSEIDTHHRKSLVATLKKIHQAGVVHGDISAANVCVKDGSEGFIIDFTHARWCSTPELQAAEIATLCRLLHFEAGATAAQPKRTVTDMTNLKRSNRLKKLNQDAEVAKAAAAMEAAAKEAAVEKGGFARQTKNPSKKNKAPARNSKRPSNKKRQTARRSPIAEDAAEEAAKKATKKGSVAKGALTAKATSTKTAYKSTSSSRHSRLKEKDVKLEVGPYKATRSRSKL
jgi:serine/threonine protein kinase